MTFLRGFSVNVAATALTVGLGVANQALIARGLGPEGRGQLALVATVVLLGGLLLGEWLARGNTYQAGRCPERAGPVWANTAAYGLGLVLVAAVVARGAAALGLLQPLTPWQLLLGAWLTAALVIQRGFLGVLLGEDRMAAYALVPVVFIGLYLALNGVGFGFLDAGLTAVLVAWLAAVSLSAVLAAALSHRRARPQGGLLAATAVVGGRAAMSATLIFLLFRSDVFLVGYFLGEASLGVYAIAVMLAEMMQRLPNLAGAVMLPKVLHGGDDGHEVSLAVSRWVLAFSLVAAAGVLLLGAPLIRWVFGTPYAGAHQPLVCMLPGLVAAAYGSVLNTKLAGQGYPPVTMWAPALALAANVGLNLAWIPAHGLLGAAWATSVAYVVWAAIVTVAYLRSTGLPPARLLRRGP